MAFFYSHPLTTALAVVALAYGIGATAILKRAPRAGNRGLS